MHIYTHRHKEKKIFSIYVNQNIIPGGMWLPQSLEHAILDLGVVNSSRTLWVELTFFKSVISG